LKDRCLLAADLPDYPDAKTRKVSGTVTLAGRIDRNGKMANIRVVEAQSVPPDSKDLLVRTALANFKTWQLDSAPRADAVRITYSYVIDPSMSRGLSKVELALPGRVTITGNPSD
jgi:TonB family protein